MRLLTKGIFLTIAALFSAGAISFGSGVPAAVHYIDHDKVAAIMAKGGSIVSDPGLVVLAQRRKAGQVEYHERTNHVFIIVEGEATLVVGGRRGNLPFEQRRRDYDTGEDAALVQGTLDANDRLLCCEHRE
jgi:hypothetical protein